MTLADVEAKAHAAARAAIKELPAGVQPYARGAGNAVLHPVSSAGKAVHIADSALQAEVDRHAKEAGRSFGAGAREGSGLGGIAVLGAVGLGAILLAVTVKDW